MLETSDCVALESAWTSCVIDASPGVSATADVPASACASARFSCPTGLPFPGSSTRTVTWVLPTFPWSAAADAVAPWSIDVPWSAWWPGAFSEFPGPFGS